MLKYIKAHELAFKLLSMPNLPVVIPDDMESNNEDQIYLVDEIVVKTTRAIGKKDSIRNLWDLCWDSRYDADNIPLELQEIKEVIYIS